MSHCTIRTLGPRDPGTLGHSDPGTLWEPRTLETMGHRKGSSLDGNGLSILFSTYNKTLTRLNYIYKCFFRDNKYPNIFQSTAN